MCITGTVDIFLPGTFLFEVLVMHIMYFQKHTKSLELISRLYKHFLSHDFQFGGDSSYLAAMNDYIRQSHEKFK